MTPAERDRKEQTVVRVCAKGHPTVTYYARRDQPEPPCPACRNGLPWPPKEDERDGRVLQRD